MGRVAERTLWGEGGKRELGVGWRSAKNNQKNLSSFVEDMWFEVFDRICWFLSLYCSYCAAFTHRGPKRKSTHDGIIVREAVTTALGSYVRNRNEQSSQLSLTCQRNLPWSITLLDGSLLWSSELTTQSRFWPTTNDRPSGVRWGDDERYDGLALWPGRQATATGIGDNPFCAKVCV